MNNKQWVGSTAGVGSMIRVDDTAPGATVYGFDVKKIILLVLILAAVTAFFTFGGEQYLRPDFYLRVISEQPRLSAVIYFVSYVVMAVLSLPGAAIMTVLAGALFGLWQGVLLVSFASSIGATLAFLVSRFLLRDWVQARFSSHLERVNRGIEKDGALYLFSLRLIPVIPFFVINLVMGLVPIRTLTFYLVSQIGMLAGTLVYVNAGVQLASLEELSVADEALKYTHEYTKGDNT